MNGGGDVVPVAAVGASLGAPSPGSGAVRRPGAGASDAAVQTAGARAPRRPCAVGKLRAPGVVVPSREEGGRRRAASWRVLAAFVALGLGSWIVVNGVFQELVLIAQHAPEGYSVFSYTSVLVACANFFPVAYVVARRALPRVRWSVMNARLVFCVVLGCGVPVCVLLVAFWHSTVHVAGQRRSLALWVLIFLGGAVDCMTSVLFYPFASLFERSAITALLVGEALTGFIASVLAYVQQEEPSGNFTVSAYFAVLAGVMLASGAGFAYILADLRAAERGRTGHYASLSDADDASDDEDQLQLARRQQQQLQQRGQSVGVGGFATPSPRLPQPQALMLLQNDKTSSADTAAFVGTMPSPLPPPARPRAAAAAAAAAAAVGVGVVATPQPPPLWAAFVGQAVLGFVENGVYTTLLPHALAPFPAADHERFVSVAVKVGSAGASLFTVLAYVLRRRRARFFTGPLSTCGYMGWLATFLGPCMCGAVILWLSTLTQGAYAAASGRWVVAMLVACKWSLAFGKTSWFLVFTGSQAALWGGSGIQTGGTVGSVLFFLLTVTKPSFNKPI